MFHVSPCDFQFDFISFYFFPFIFNKKKKKSVFGPDLQTKFCRWALSTNFILLFLSVFGTFNGK